MINTFYFYFTTCSIWSKNWSTFKWWFKHLFSQTNFVVQTWLKFKPSLIQFIYLKRTINNKDINAAVSLIFKSQLTNIFLNNLCENCVKFWVLWLYLSTFLDGNFHFSIVSELVFVLSIALDLWINKNINILRHDLDKFIPHWLLYVPDLVLVWQQ